MAGLTRKREGSREGKTVGGKEGLGNAVIARDDKQDINMEDLILRGLKKFNLPSGDTSDSER